MQEKLQPFTPTGNDAMRFILFILLCTASENDKTAIKTVWKNRFNDTSFVRVSDLPLVRNISNTNQVAWMMATSLQQLKTCGANLENVTKEKFDEWKDANMEHPAHFLILSTTNIVQEMVEENIEYVPGVDPIIGD